MHPNKTINHAREIRIARISIITTLLLFAGVFHFIFSRAHGAYKVGNTSLLIEALVFGIAIFFIAYGNLIYQVCLVGYYKRRKKHIPASREALEKLYEAAVPSLSILVPSYKEEKSIIWQTLLSAALAEYPKKHIVLLIDDPYRAKALEDMLKLEDTRLIPGELQALFAAPLAHCQAEFTAFEKRKEEGRLYQGVELNRIAMLYEEAADWLEALAQRFIGKRDISELSHTERFFIESILYAPVQKHRALAKELHLKMTVHENLNEAFLARHYVRLAGLFDVTFASFERKKYNNLSHEANKAMNLNSYIALIGKAWKEKQVVGGWELHEAVSPEEADFTIPVADYINTIDADSLMLSDYLMRMIEMMERPENARMAVIQSSVSSVPDSPNLLERTAGICLDLQFMNHQGFTYWNATFWVGANAMLRHKALEDIRETKHEDGKEVTIYIQDRTVIEDTESTVDLVEKGWELHNYPERLSYSAMPSDFGSLLIQRRRWANGGMIILPKLLRYIVKAPKNLKLLQEIIMRFHYLAATTIGCIVIAMLSVYNFGDDMSTLWIMLSTIPCSLLYLRTLYVSGYKTSDILRVATLNLMLVPVLFGGVLKQFEQIVTGKKIPFGRTPKVTGRTASPALYCLIEVVMAAAFVSTTASDVAHHSWFHAVFTAINASFMLYALVYFMGIRETFEDMFAGLRAYWKEAFHQAEIIPLSTARKVEALLPPLRQAS